MKKTELPILLISHTKFQIDLAQFRLINIKDKTDFIDIKTIMGVIAEDEFEILFDEKNQKVVKPNSQEGKSTSNVAVYRFDGIDLLDPIGYARLRGIDERLFSQYYDLRDLIVAHRFPIKTRQQLRETKPLKKFPFSGEIRAARLRKGRRI